MVSTGAGRLEILVELSVFQIAVGPVLLRAAAPSSEGYDFVEFLPLRESIVRCVVDDDSTAVLNIFKESGVGLLALVVTVVIQYDHVVKAEIGSERTHIATRFGSQGDIG